MSNTDEVVIPSQIWSAFPTTTEDNRISVYAQILSHLATLPMPSVQTVLDKAPAEIKSIIWYRWAQVADLSGVMLADVIGLQETEPIKAIYSIVLEWLGKVDLSKYDLRQVSKAASLLRGLDDKQKLWARWLDHSSELRAINLIEFAIAISDYSPELQVVLINGFARNCPNIGMYSTDERAKAKKHLNAWAVAQCSIFGNGTSKVATRPKYENGVKVQTNDGRVGRIESSLQAPDGTWHYSVSGRFTYCSEAEIARMA